MKAKANISGHQRCSLIPIHEGVVAHERLHKAGDFFRQGSVWLPAAKGDKRALKCSFEPAGIKDPGRPSGFL